MNKMGLGEAKNFIGDFYLKNAAAAVTHHEFYDIDNPPEVTTFTPIDNVAGTDALTGQQTTLHQFSIQSTNAFKQSTSSLLLSPASDYRRYVYDAGESSYETVTQNLFDQAVLQPVDATNSSSNLQFLGFSQGDFDKSTLSYALGLGAAGPFDNYQAYADVTPLDPSALPTGTPPAATWFKVANRGDVTDWNALGKVKFSDTLASGDKTYLGETYYLNYSDPAVKSVTDYLNQYMTDPTQVSTLNVVQVVLVIVAKSIVYDYQALNSSAVTPMRAGDALTAGKGICQHFAAAYAALARSIGLPARVITGHALFPNKDGSPADGFHAWVEVQVGNWWLPVDPTVKAYVIKSQQYLPIEISPVYNSPQVTQDTLSAQAAAAFNHHPMMVKIIK